MGAEAMIIITMELSDSDLALLHTALACREHHYRTKAAQATGLAEQGAYAIAMYAAQRIRSKLPTAASDTATDTL